MYDNCLKLRGEHIGVMSIRDLRNELGRLEKEENTLKYFTIPNLRGTGYRVGGAEVNRREGEINPWSHAIGRNIADLTYMYKLSGDTPVGFNKEELRKVAKALQISKSPIEGGGTLLLSPINEETLVLPGKISLEEGKSYYLNKPIGLQLKKLSQQVGTQITLWVDEKQKTIEGNDYNHNASQLLTNETMIPTKISGTAILSERRLKGDLLDEHKAFSREILQNLIVAIEIIDKNSIGSFMDLNGMFEQLKLEEKTSE